MESRGNRTLCTVIPLRGSGEPGAFSGGRQQGAVRQQQAVGVHPGQPLKQGEEGKGPRPGVGSCGDDLDQWLEGPGLS